MKYGKQFIGFLSDFICGDESIYPIYRSSYYLTQFFKNIGIDETHDGTTRKFWVQSILENLDTQKLYISSTKRSAERQAELMVPYLNKKRKESALYPHREKVALYR
ncbi:MAG: hypothetical protein ACRCS8_02825 [Brevinema sp.]